MKLLVILSSVLFFTSSILLFKHRNKCGKVGLIYLTILHAIIFFGFILQAIYEIFNLGNIFSQIRVGEIRPVSYWFVLIICVFLFFFVKIFLRETKANPSNGLIHANKSMSIQVFFLLPIFLFIYLAALKFNTLGVGLTKTVTLPYRLNGILESVSLFLLPFYLALIFWNLKSYAFGFVVVTFIGLINLWSFGSKYSAIYPIVVYLFVFLILSKEFSYKRVLLPLIIILSLYTIFNPYLFRILLATNQKTSFIDSFRMSFVNEGPNQLIVGMRNFSRRIIGLEVMDIVIYIVKNINISTYDVVGFLNQYFNLSNTSIAPGHFGFFIVFTRNEYLGLFLGLFVLGFFLWIAIKFDKSYYRNNNHKTMILGSSLMLMILPLLIDGDYLNISNYLHIVFQLFVLNFMLNTITNGKNITVV